ncbi:MAG TPA: phosphoglycerate dehydrogenase, partial [Clostridia bacterium]|nr:phosphoglycerate dehydrogenase [Clostridia bacterium]
ILVVNAPGGNTIAAAEHTMAMMLALTRNIPRASNMLKQGVWNKKIFVGEELRNKVLGVIGLGRIGSAVAKRAMGMEMRVKACDPFISEARAEALGVEMVPAEEVIKEADFLTVHLPLTKESKHMISTEAFAKMKDGVRIVHCARGGIVDEAALFEALKSGKVAGAALDVFEKEPTTESPLFDLDNVIVTPHLGASTKEAQLNVAAYVAEEIVACLKGHFVKNTVNIPSMNREQLASVKPFLLLAEKLGVLQSQLVKRRISKLQITYSGDAFGEVTPITASLIKGFLNPILQEKVNFVNAALMAKSRGIQVDQVITGKIDGYSNLISVKVTAEDYERSVAGTLFNGDDLRIVEIDGYRVDAIPEGHMLVIPHYDRPKIIGKVGTLIGSHDINIAGMQVGRKKIGGKAIMLLAVDAQIPEDTLKEIAGVDGIMDVKMVSL